MKRFLTAAIACLAVTPAVAAPSTLATCAGSHVIDRCLVGTWSYSSGGSAAWMARNIHQAHVTGISHGELKLTFRADGTFATNPVDIHANVAANDGSMTGAAHATGQASGTWSAAGGHFNLCTTPGSVTNTVTVMVHGRPITVTPHTPVAPHATAYTCNAATLITTQTILKGREPLVTTYSRGH